MVFFFSYCGKIFLLVCERRISHDLLLKQARERAATGNLGLISAGKNKASI